MHFEFIYFFFFCIYRNQLLYVSYLIIISCARILLFDIAEDCGKDELEKMKFYSRTTLHLPKKMVDKVKSCLDLFNVLEKEEKITNIDVNTLEQLIKTTGDEELLESVYQYKNRNLGTYILKQENALYGGSCRFEGSEYIHVSR